LCRTANSTVLISTVPIKPAAEQNPGTKDKLPTGATNSVPAFVASVANSEKEMLEFAIMFAIGWFVAKRSLKSQQHVEHILEELHKEKRKTHKHYDLTQRTVDEINDITITV